MTISRDIFHALRQFRKNPSLTAITILTFALGIGVNAAVFTLTYTVVLERLPVPHPAQLVRYTFQNGSQDIGLSGPLYDALIKHENGVTGLLAWSQSPLAVEENGSVNAVHGALMTGNGFRVLDLRPMLGRAFDDADDTAGGGSSGYQALLGYDYWREHFHGTDSVLGQALTVNGRPVTVIGVLPQGFDGVIVGERTDLLLPLSFETVLYAPNSQRRNAGGFWLTVMGRLKPGETLQSATANLRATETMVREEADQKHMFMSGFFKPFKLGVESGSSGRSFLRMAYESPLIVLEILAGLLLLLCCTNVSLLMMARLTGRRREFAVRLALGASRARIVWLVLSEGIALAACGLAGGVLLGWWTAQSLVAMIASLGEAPPIDVTPRAIILAVTAGVTVLSALLANIFPALHAGRATPQPDLKQTQASSALKSLGGWFVPAQVAVAIVLLACASLLTGTLRSLLLQRSGFRADGLVMADADLSAEKPSATMAAQQGRTILEQVSNAPGVEAAALMSTPPLHSWWSSQHFFSLDQRGNVHTDMEAWPESVSPNYFATMGTPIEQGRGFSQSDWHGPQVCVLSASSARYFFPDENPLGKIIYASGKDPQLDGKSKVDPTDTCTIIGIAGEAHFHSLRESSERAVYQLFQNDEPGSRFTLAVKGAGGNAIGLASVIREAIHSTAASAIAPTPYTFTALMNDDLKRERVLTILSSCCAAVALLLTALGLYALLARLVALRTREIGIRLALGSQRAVVLAMVIRDGMKLVLSGVVVGLIASLAAPRVLRSLLEGVTSNSLIFAAAVGVLIVVALAACYLPARRAATVDPMVALRYD